MLRDKYHGQACAYCSRPMDRGHPKLLPTRDHVIPVCRGGTAKVICCTTCNGLKADMMPDVWAAYMAANPGWWLLSKAERRARARSSRRQYDLPNMRGNRVVKRGTARKPVIVPPELIWETT